MIVGEIVNGRRHMYAYAYVYMRAYIHIYVICANTCSDMCTVGKNELRGQHKSQVSILYSFYCMAVHCARNTNQSVLSYALLLPFGQNSSKRKTKMAHEKLYKNKILAKRQTD